MLNKQALVKQFRTLSTDEKLALLHTLWHEVEAETESYPLSAEEQSFLDERLRQVEEEPRGDRCWEDVRRDLLGR